jgi:transcriptional regulator with XRE-family HTH domain
MLITPEQCRGARAMLSWSRDELAAAAKVAVRTLVDFERGARRPHDRTLRDIRAALEEAGVMFIDANGGGAGVRLRAPR